MQKIFYFFSTLILGALVAAVAFDLWRTHTYVQANGREGTLVVGQRYNASRWATPLPLKKIHTYAARMAPNYDVVIESDQELAPKQQIFIRYLTVDASQAAAMATRFRPVSGMIRLRTEADGTPVAIEPTGPLDHMLAKAMGTPAKAPTTVDTKRPAFKETGKGSPFLIGGANDNLLELVWNNSSATEWIFGAIMLFLLQALAINAWTLPWRKFRPCDEDKSFVHPTLVAIEPDAPRPSPKPIAFKPKSRDAAPETPSAPAQTSDPVLRLPRK